ncbi:MAG TPA: pantoate--beta-alanine ligase [Solirubrobacteraceae bacterium]|nr:pantoate--beta-alanine ligase [Solirubrobacteraceae bacterium]
MSVLRSVAALRSYVAAARAGGRLVGLVPTMGALHAGHLALLDAARAECDVVVASIFVNPTQFDRADDLERYPRDEARDIERLAGAGCDALFAPAREEMYPPGFATTVHVGEVTGRFEGAVRGAEHFNGVATVVTKLLCACLPDVAYFGRKDAQQLHVIRRLVSDLNIPVRVASVATVRDSDGLALSSRNELLTDAERLRARAMPDGLAAAAAALRSGERDAAAIAAAARAAMTARGADVEYVAVVDPGTFTPVEHADGDVLVAVAARVGAVRLIDNETFAPAAADATRTTDTSEVATAA